MSSSSLPDKAIELTSDSPLPEDRRAHQELLSKLVSALDIQTEEMCEDSHKLMDILVSVAPDMLILPTNEAIIELVKVL